MHEHMCKSPESVVDAQINLFFISFSENGISYFLYGDFKIEYGCIFTVLISVLISIQENYSNNESHQTSIAPNNLFQFEKQLYEKIFTPFFPAYYLDCIDVDQLLFKPGGGRIIYRQWKYPDNRSGCGQSAGHGGINRHDLHLYTEWRGYQ